MSQTAPAAPTTPNVREMTLREANVLFNALPLLDGLTEETVTEDLKTNEKKVTRKLIKTYSFGKRDENGKLVGGSKIRYNGGHDLDILKPFVDRVNKQRDEHINRLSDGKGQIEKTDPKYNEKLQEINRELEALLDNKVTVAGLLSLPFDYLNLDENPELGTVTLMQLKPLITGVPTD